MINQPNELSCSLPTLEATQNLGKCLSVLLHQGDFVVLRGDLGTGKTTLTQAILASWGIDGVLSPTFTLMHSYQAEFPIHHVDLYRLDREEEVWDIGWEELLYGTSLVLVEWLDKFPELYPEQYITIHIAYEEGIRRVHITDYGAKHAHFIEELSSCVAISH